MKGDFIQKVFIAISIFAFSQLDVDAQCCAGGSGSCIAGGASQGVLQYQQLELNTNFQFINTDKFYKKDSPETKGSFDRYSSQYEYFRIAYGLSKNLTFSVESGYYLLKKEVGLNKNPASSYTSKGFGDLIIFPRYDILNASNEKTVSEITVGLGYKIPLGSYNDSTGNIEPFSGKTYYVTTPQSVQLSSGAQDLIFYTFLYREYLKSKFKIFANAMYIRKGYNPNGEKLGDFLSVGLFTGRSFFKNFGITLQLRYEKVEQMKINENILLYGKPSTYFPEATGYKKVFFTPQVSFSKGKFTIYASTDLPLYQYINSSDYYTQVGSKYTTTVGVSFRFFTKRTEEVTVGAGKYCCPMHPEEISETKFTCPKCHMDMVKAKK
ncbi:hypothetical protein BH11BAC1_BH11BAC1_14520 [soil metagenome]